MNRSTFILGFALLVVATTMALTITFRNDPARGAADQAARSPRATGKPTSSAPRPGSTTPRPGSSQTRHADSRHRFEVTIPVEALAGRPATEQAEFHRRADAVQQEARRKLERMTEEFALTSSQRAKMFPVLVRSNPGYDPAMQVGGIYLTADPLTPAGEEMHDLLDPDQKERLEDEELDRHLWWEDVFDRIETELIGSTGGMPIVEPAAGQNPNPGERNEPTSRGGNSR